ncbi:MAG: sn-glycerol-3-phosphate ABC transporter ATP-binding protein UgpC [Hyphomicrobium sp.]|nr:sn-glycerol-3-phosphate ABC transporter ATP-binding protein UgpC [Hyphomicrobium sp.]
MSELKLSNVRKSFGSAVVLENINLEIADGELVVFVGPSGCGKSTLLRLIAGLDEVSGGEICIDGRIVNDVAPARRGVAMVFQSYALYPHMTVYENMSFGLRLAKLDKTEIEAAVRAAARTLHIEHLLDKKPKVLSGGQRQRVAIGRAIVRKPKVFLFDEPLSNLDAALRASMRYELAKLHAELKTTMIYVTHDQIEAMTLAKRIVVLSAGCIEQVGTPMDIYRDPDNVFVAGFIGSPRMNFLAAEIESAGARGVVVQLASGDTITAAVDAGAARPKQRVTLGIRPEHFNPRAQLNVLPVKVRFVESLGSVTIAYGTLARTETEVTVQLPGDVEVRPGETIRPGCAPSACYLFDADGRAFRRLAEPVDETPEVALPRGRI